MNTRLQVEHPVTEFVTGVDIVKEQIRVAAGEKLALRQKDVRFEGHSIEVRITAEDPKRNYAPSAGTIETCYLPGGMGVRVDSHAYAGYEIPPYYDPMLAKLIVWAPDRAQAIARMERCLRETEITGVPTNISLQQAINADEEYRKGNISTSFVPERILT
jgi:Biotin carboxylase